MLKTIGSTEMSTFRIGDDEDEVIRFGVGSSGVESL